MHDLNSLYRVILNVNNDMKKLGEAKRLLVDSWTEIQKSTKGDKRKFADTLMSFNKIHNITGLVTFDPAVGTSFTNDARYMLDAMVEMKTDIVENA